MLHIQPPTYPYHGVCIQHLYLPQTTAHSPLANMSPPFSHSNTSHVHILPQSSQVITPVVVMCFDVLCCVVLCCAVLCVVAMCCVVLCRAVFCYIR